MAEIRRDAVTGRSVIIAPDRAHRPGAFSTASAAPSIADCPFCRGLEDRTPREVLTLPADAGEDWNVRVVPNKFPALVAPPASCDSTSTTISNDDPLFCTAPAIGAHEVIVEDPRHISVTSDSTAENVRDVFRAYRDRFRHWKQEESLIWPIAFKNLGAASGATLDHLHSQLMVLPVVPPIVTDRLANGRQYFDRHRRCVMCDMLEREQADSTRTIANGSRFVTFCPYASSVPYETWIVPRTHASRFEAIDDEALSELGVVALRTLRAIECHPAGASYNLILHTAPFDMADCEHYHWHIEVLPHQVKIAGFERGSGMGLNPVPPERAATILRDLANQS